MHVKKVSLHKAFWSATSESAPGVGAATVEAEHGGGATHEEKDRELAVLRKENAQLWDWLDQTIDFAAAEQQMFAA
jgi:hypothetical protein